MASRVSEGYLQVEGGRIWYQIVGTGPATPLLCIHGGPGFTHDYLETLADLSGERPVVFYDQLGSGNSERPDDDSLWTVERFVGELGQLRTALRLDRVHLLGQSWGGLLALEYLLTRPTGIASVAFASPCLSVPLWLRDVNDLRAQLPQMVRDVLAREEAQGTFGSPAHRWAMREYNQRHLCRVTPWPVSLERSLARSGQPVGRTLWGPSEFSTDGGRLGEFDHSSRLPEVRAPVLWTCGRFDQAQPRTIAHYRELLPRSRYIEFDNSSHTAHLEERERYVHELRLYLRQVDRRGLARS